MKKNLKEKFLKKIEKELQEPSEEQYIINTIRAYYDFKEMKNLIEERLIEWIKNSFYLDVKLSDDINQLIKKYQLDPYPFNKGHELYILISQKEKELREYIEKIIEKRFPNSSYLIGPFIVAMFLEKVGSFKKLAELPASTLQVIGAEKALFKHIRSKGKIKPPKHGILYLSNWVNRLPKKLRGKMARTLASKLSIAFKADLAGRNISEELYKAVEKRYKELEEKK